MNWFKCLLLLPAATVMLAGPSHAQVPKVDVGTPWARATPPAATTGAVYLSLSSPAGDTLTAVSSPAAATAEVHEMSMDGDVMRMRELPSGLSLPAGQAVTLKPGGFHIMLLGLKAPLKQGDTVRLHLTFAKAAPMDISASVTGLGATAAPGAPVGTPAHGMKMH